ncbi:alpha/beta hydrolase [Roseivirga sp. BDSF3-8]|uniref:alpha/beta hydrolase n=1 Tax=Roseivirga sp. BDSF3-8 TaxID=3241598 RepID=UPI003531BB79
MKEHSTSVTIQSRYFTNDHIKQPRQVWMACHGYGQLAKYFIRHFDPLASQGVKVVAPEGMHRFYLNGTEGRVGASWMTKEDRLNDIDNYLGMLNTVYDMEIAPLQPVPVTLFGFSQGASTISRFAMDERIHFDRLVIWAGVFPPDVPLELGRKRLEGKEVWFVYGTKDDYIDEKRVGQIKDLLEETGLRYQIRSFDGPHTLNQGVLKELATPY